MFRDTIQTKTICGTTYTIVDCPLCAVEAVPLGEPAFEVALETVLGEALQAMLDRPDSFRRTLSVPGTNHVSSYKIGRQLRNTRNTR